MAQFKVFCTAILISLSNLLMAQAPTLVINEVSNGMSGTREYIELLVVGPPSQPCSPPETLDLRKWILDDNTGFLDQEMELPQVHFVLKTTLFGPTFL